MSSSIYKRNPDQNSTRRIGHVKGNKRRKFFNSKRNATVSLGMEVSDNNVPNDIDDFDDKDKNLTGTTNASFDYKFSDANTTMKISVKYIDDNNTSPVFDFNISALSTTTNIKMITVSLNNSQLDGNLTLRAFSCNIGANQLLRKDFY